MNVTNTGTACSVHSVRSCLRAWEPESGARTRTAATPRSLRPSGNGDTSLSGGVPRRAMKNMMMAHIIKPGHTNTARRNSAGMATEPETEPTLVPNRARDRSAFSTRRMHSPHPVKPSHGKCEHPEVLQGLHQLSGLDELMLAVLQETRDWDLRRQEDRYPERTAKHRPDEQHYHQREQPKPKYAGHAATRKQK